MGDSLYGVKDSTRINFDTLNNEEIEAFTLGFIIGDGCDHNNQTTVRLCGNKIEYLNLFFEGGIPYFKKSFWGRCFSTHVVELLNKTL